MYVSASIAPLPTGPDFIQLLMSRNCGVAVKYFSIEYQVPLKRYS